MCTVALGAETGVVQVLRYCGEEVLDAVEVVCQKESLCALGLLCAHVKDGGDAHDLLNSTLRFTKAYPIKAYL